VIAIEVEINRERYCVAGVPAGVASAFVNHVDIPAEPGGERHPSTMLTVSGFHFHAPGAQTAVHWRDVAHTLRPGDEVRLRIVETEAVDPYTETPMLPDVPEEEG
jgi:protein involved in polysaccharide export with SLBB domain